jgi:hypothetical protein
MDCRTLPCNKPWTSVEQNVFTSNYRPAGRFITYNHLLTDDYPTPTRDLGGDLGGNLGGDLVGDLGGDLGGNLGGDLGGDLGGTIPLSNDPPTLLTTSDLTASDLLG